MNSKKLKKEQQNLRVQKWVAALSVLILAIKFIAYYSTHHPYGHGKAEFISAAIEGTLISSAGAIILYKAVQNLIHPVELQKLDIGIWLVAVTAVANFAIGYFCLQTGKRNNSLALIASGKHLQSDTYSTLGIIAGLLLLYFTKLKWIDSVVAILFGVIIIITGYKIMRRSIAGIMDEADLVPECP